MNNFVLPWQLPPSDKWPHCIASRRRLGQLRIVLQPPQVRMDPSEPNRMERSCTEQESSERESAAAFTPKKQSLPSSLSSQQPMGEENGASGNTLDSLEKVLLPRVHKGMGLCTCPTTLSVPTGTYVRTHVPVLDLTRTVVGSSVIAS